MIAGVRGDPIARFRRAYAAAARARVPLPDAMALATADARGNPSVRYVLLKQVDERGFVFFTDGRSRKGRELAARPRASVAFYWDATGTQVRVEGRVVPVTAAETEAYWVTRPRESRLAAASSLQSAPLERRADLLARWRQLAREVGAGAVPRPEAWAGYRIVPDAIEFWRRGAHRLHTRERYQRKRGAWRHRFLQP